MGDLSLVTRRARCHKRPSVLLQGGPPKPSLEKVKGPSYSRVEGKARTMTPLQNLRPDSGWNKETVSRTPSGVLFLSLGPPNGGLDLLSNRGHHFHA